MRATRSHGSGTGDGERDISLVLCEPLCCLSKLLRAASVEKVFSWLRARVLVAVIFEVSFVDVCRRSVGGSRTRASAFTAQRSSRLSYDQREKVLAGAAGLEPAKPEGRLIEGQAAFSILHTPPLMRAERFELSLCRV